MSGRQEKVVVSTAMNKTRILYAEDEKDLRELTEEILSAEGFECVAVKDGIAAQQVLQTEKFDLLLTDFNMPNLDGANLLFWCRQNNFHFPVIFITGSPERLPMHQRALNDSCSILVNKPFNFRDLLNAIEQGLDKGRLFGLHGKVCVEESDDSFMGQLTLD